MDTNTASNQLLQAILHELRATRQPLGFGPSPRTRTIYANRQFPNCLWYFWNGAKNQHEPIQAPALTGIVERLEVGEKEYKGKDNPKINLHVRAYSPYVIQSGLETQFARGLLYMLSKLPTAALAQPITIAVEAGESENVLFCRLYNPVTGKAVHAPYSENTDWQAVMERAMAKIAQAHDRTEPGQIA